MPLQPSPRPHTISSLVEAVLYSTIFGAPILMTRLACSITSDSRHPALIVPVLAPPSQTSMRAPGRRYEDPSTLTTVASAHRSPLLFASSNASTNARTSFTVVALLTGLPQKSLCHKEAPKAQIGSADFLSFWCLFVAKDMLL